MGLLMLFGAIIIVLLAITLIITRGIYWVFIIVSIPLLLLLQFMSTGVPIEQYPYTTQVRLENGDRQFDTVYFSAFSQNENLITINKYATTYFRDTHRSIHWTDFIGYDVSPTPLTITLLDNDNKFIYTDRRTGETFNDPAKLNAVIATQ
jgi:hypothetical protein